MWHNDQASGYWGFKEMYCLLLPDSLTLKALWYVNTCPVTQRAISYDLKPSAPKLWGSQIFQHNNLATDCVLFSFILFYGTYLLTYSMEQSPSWEAYSKICSQSRNSPHLWKNNDIAPTPSQNYIWHPIANKLYSLNCWYYSVTYKKPVPNWWFSFPFP
jgi:hypothetical protein